MLKGERREQKKDRKVAKHRRANNRKALLLTMEAGFKRNSGGRHPSERVSN